jgi:hypothetical protein
MREEEGDDNYKWGGAVILEFSIAYSAALCQDNPTFIPSYFSVDI